MKTVQLIKQGDKTLGVVITLGKGEFTESIFITDMKGSSEINYRLVVELGRKDVSACVLLKNGEEDDAYTFRTADLASMEFTGEGMIVIDWDKNIDKGQAKGITSESIALLAAEKVAEDKGLVKFAK